MAALIEGFLEQHYEVVGISAAALLMLGTLLYVSTPSAPLYARGDRTLYSVGTLSGTVTATTTPAARHLYVYRSADHKLIAVLRADRFGRFGTTLMPGEYMLVTAFIQHAPVPTGAIMATVEEGSTTVVALDTEH